MLEGTDKIGPIAAMVYSRSAGDEQGQRQPALTNSLIASRRQARRDQRHGERRSDERRGLERRRLERRRNDRRGDYRRAVDRRLAERRQTDRRDCDRRQTDRRSLEDAPLSGVSGLQPGHTGWGNRRRPMIDDYA